MEGLVLYICNLVVFVVHSFDVLLLVVFDFLVDLPRSYHEKLGYQIELDCFLIYIGLKEIFVFPMLWKI